MHTEKASRLCCILGVASLPNEATPNIQEGLEEALVLIAEWVGGWEQDLHVNIVQ